MHMHNSRPKPKDPYADYLHQHLKKINSKKWGGDRTRVKIGFMSSKERLGLMTEILTKMDLPRLGDEGRKSLNRLISEMPWPSIWELLLKHSRNVEIRNYLLNFVLGYSSFDEEEIEYLCRLPMTQSQCDVVMSKLIGQWHHAVKNLMYSHRCDWKTDKDHLREEQEVEVAEKLVKRFFQNVSDRFDPKWTLTFLKTREKQIRDSFTNIQDWDGTMKTVVLKRHYQTLKRECQLLDRLLAPWNRDKILEKELDILYKKVGERRAAEILARELMAW